MAKTNVVYMRDMKNVPQFRAVAAKKAAKRARRHGKMKAVGALILVSVIILIGMVVLSARACQEPRIGENPIYKCR
ncbi:MAG: hypothetical protein ACYC8S_00900 [Minisyncoccota bacterium]